MGRVMRDEWYVVPLSAASITTCILTSHVFTYRASKQVPLHQPTQWRILSRAPGSNEENTTREGLQ